MKRLSILTAVALTIGAMTFSTAQAQINIVTDGFEGDPGVFSTDWDATNNATIMTTGAGSGANGTDGFATIASGAPAAPNANLALGAVVGGVPDICIDFFVQVQDVEARQFNFQLGSAFDFINTNNAGLNLRFENGGWDAFSAGWQPISGLTPLTPGAWHRVKVNATGWGTEDASYDIEVSAAGGTTFESSATGLTFFQSGDPTVDDIETFNFNARFGANPGFNIDEVTATTLTEVAPDILLGDVNQDEAVNFLDISPFIGVLSSGGDQAEADVNQDTVVSFLDISPFIVILSGGTP